MARLYVPHGIRATFSGDAALLLAPELLTQNSLEDLAGAALR